MLDKDPQVSGGSGTAAIAGLALLKRSFPETDRGEKDMKKDFTESFAAPEAEYSMAPFWFLNDGLDPRELERQLEEMYSKGVYECVAHARKGMSVRYLSEEWFDRISVILNKAQKLGMRIWIYDEDNWPSGYAGGKVTDGALQLAAHCLSMEKIIPVLRKPISVEKIPDKPIVKIIAVHNNQEFFDITDIPDWITDELQYEVFVFRTELCGHRPAYSDLPYADLLNREATEKFIAVTHAEYKKRFPNHWGSTIKGFFTDEPGFYQNYIYQAHNLNTIPWTEKFSGYFAQKKGYDISLYLCSIWDDMGELSHKTRRDFFEVMCGLYNESYFKPLKDFLSDDGLLLIGHLHMEEHFENTVPMEFDFFSDMRYLDYAGIDRIDRGRRRVTEKLGASAMHLQGKKFCFSESMGCFGWGLTAEEIKSEIDWQYVRGINKLVPHAFFSSIEGFRKNECPPSFFYQNTFWKYFDRISSYVSRLSFALSEGLFSARVLVYYPIKSCWQEYRPLDTYTIRKIDESFIELSVFLLENQIDYDYLPDEYISTDSVEGSRIKAGEGFYSAVIIPPLTFIPEKTLSAFEKFANNGGLLINLSDYGNSGVLKSEVKTLEEIPFILENKGLLDVRLLKKNKSIKYQHRKINGNDLYFIVNESPEEQHLCAELSAEGTEILQYDPATGKTEEYNAKRFGGKAVVNDVLEPFGTRLLYFKKTVKERLVTENWRIILPDGSRRENEPLPFAELGLAAYSGTVEYKCDFRYNGFGKIYLELGEVLNIAEISVNEKLAEVILWRPYSAEITEYAVKGINTLSIKVTNTPANSLTDKKPASGLMSVPELFIEK